MPASGERGPGSYVTFEVTMARDAPEQVAALQGLRRAFDWNLHERATLLGDLDRTGVTRPWIIEDGEFIDLSEDVWGVDTYGQNSVDQLRYEARVVAWSAGCRVYHNGYSLGDSDNPRYDAGEINHPGPRLTPEQMRARALEVWDMNRSPFELVHADIGVHVPRALDLQPVPVTRDRLADFVRARGYDEHELHGALGKTLDLFGLASGMLDADSLRSGSDGVEFIESSELAAMMEVEISPSARRRIQTRIVEQLSSQLEVGRSVNDIEVIVDGLTTRRHNHPQYSLTYQRIATVSLSALATLYKQNSQGRRFLRQF